MSDYFLGLARVAGFLIAVFLEGRPSFGSAMYASTSARSTNALPATVTFDNLPRRMRSAMACLDTPRMRAASA